MGIYSLVEGGVAERLVTNIHKLGLRESDSLLRERSPELVKRLQLIYIDLSRETESMVNSIYKLPAVLQELDEEVHLLGINIEGTFGPSFIDASTPNKGIYGYDRSPEMLKKGLEAQAKAHADFLKTIYPVAQQ